MRGGKFLSLFLMLALLVTSWAFAGSSGQAATPSVSLKSFASPRAFFPVPAELASFHPIITRPGKGAVCG